MSPTARMRTALAADHLSPPRRPPEKVATVVRPRRGRRRFPHGDLHRQSDTDRNHHPGALPGRPARGTQASPETSPARGYGGRRLSRQQSTVEPARQAGHAGSIPVTRSTYRPAHMPVCPAQQGIGAAFVPQYKRPLLTADHRTRPVLVARLRHKHHLDGGSLFAPIPTWRGVPSPRGKGRRGPGAGHDPSRYVEPTPPECGGWGGCRHSEAPLGSITCLRMLVICRPGSREVR
jgi:hypothetical protein